MKIDAVMESDLRLHDSLQQLTESHKELAESHKQLDRKLAESYQRTDDALNRLSATVQAFIESMNRGGNGSQTRTLLDLWFYPSPLPAPHTLYHNFFQPPPPQNPHTP